MIAIDITKLLKSYPNVRGPSIFQHALIETLLDRDVHFVFNPYFVGSQLYFYMVSAKDCKIFLEDHMRPKAHQSIKLFFLIRLLKLGRNVLIKCLPDAGSWLLPLQRNVNQSFGSHFSAPVVHHSCIKQLLSFYPSDAMWGLPMPHTKKTLFLYDLTFFEILRTISYPVLCNSSPFIVQHIIDVKSAITEANNILVPTHYLAEQMQLHFTAARHRSINVVPLAVALEPPHAIAPTLNFRPLRKTPQKAPVLVVCGFDGFANDNKGMGSILDIINLYKMIFNDTFPTFKLITPSNDELKQRIQDLGIADCLTVRSGLPEHELMAEFKRARFIWVHSIDEGFCLPVLEASIMGKPALVSDIPSLRELWGNTVDYINPFNRYEAVNKLRSYCNGEQTAVPGANQLKAKSYTMKKTVDGVWAALKEVV
jgi:glycosyltransferase involved in cell wall biosynthesis